MEETRRENWGSWVGISAMIIPAMIAADFMPEWNVLPFSGWLAIATLGAAIGGVIATPFWFRGMIAGGLAGSGALLGMWTYVALRAAITGHHTFLKIELVAGALLGGAPGLILFGSWARFRPSAEIHDATDFSKLDG